MRLLLIEPPAIALTLDGVPCGETVLRHQKYPQLVLLANLLQRGLSRDAVAFLDLKSTTNPELRVLRRFKYGDYEAEELLVGRPLADLEPVLETFHPTLVGITANFTCERDSVRQVVRRVAEKLPGCRIVVGGHDATTAPEVYHAMGADYCAIGEGESRLYMLLSQLAIGTDLPSGILSAGTTCGRPWREPLDAVGFPQAELQTEFAGLEVPDGPVPAGVQPPFAVLETSRGCDEACSFCDSTFVVGRYRFFGDRQLADNVEVLSQAGIRSILFSDDNLLYRTLGKYGGDNGRASLLRLFACLRERHFSWSFYNGIQLSLLYRHGVIDEELVSTLYGCCLKGGSLVGCYRAYLPLEKFWPEEMAHYPKLMPLEQSREVIASIARCGLPHLNVGFILGNPRETRETVDYSEGQAQSIGELIRTASGGYTVPRFYPFCSVPIPGTPDARHFASSIAYNPLEYSCLYSNYTSVFRSKYFQPHELTRLRHRMDHALNKGSSTGHTLHTSGQNMID